MNLLPQLKNYCDSLTREFDLIATERKIKLEKISEYIREKKKLNRTINLVYICTHNSRRSHFGQAWAQAAAAYYSVATVHTFSGGTVATAMNPNAVQALTRAGFRMEQKDQGENPLYLFYHSNSENPGLFFSKEFDHPSNPSEEFAAIMVCGEAEENCPFVPGVEFRIVTTYEDPKEFDDTPVMEKMYDERCRQIAREIFYVFSKV